MLRCNDDKIQLIKGKLDIDEMFVGKVRDEPSKLFDALKTYKWLYNARYESGNLRLKLPLLNVKDELNVDVYFLVLLPNPTATDVLTYTQTIKAIKNLGFYVENIYLIHLNPNYVRGKIVDYKQLLEISEFFYNSNHNPKEHVSSWVMEKMTDYSDITNDMEKCLQGDPPNRNSANRCLRKPACSHYSECYGDFKPAKDDRGDGKMQFVKQMALANSGLHVDVLALKHWLNTSFVYPLSFVDFEWDTFNVPPYKGMKTLDTIPFQFSLDVLRKIGGVKHYDFLGTDDCRLKFLKELIRKLPRKGSIIAFNVDGGEKLRLLELKRQYPSYGKKIDKIIERMVDISLPFTTGTIYDSRLNGNFSLKSIISSIGDLSYSDLEVFDGREAIFKWRIYERTADKKVKASLLEYCRQDSYALIEIYRFLLKSLKDVV